MIHLDTSFLIRALLEATPEALALDRWIRGGETIAITSVAWCEFLCGPVEASAAALALTALGPPVPFVADDSALAASLFNATGRRRGSLADCMIAAVAVRTAAQIATTNMDDFRRFEPHGLVLATR